MISRLRSAGPRALIRSLGTSLAIQACVLVSGIVAARALGPTDRGHLALIWTVAFGVSQIGSLGLPLAVTYEIARRTSSAGAVIRMLKRGVVAQTALITGVTGLLIAGLLAVSSVPLAPALLGIVVVPALLAQTFALAVVQGMNAQRVLNRLRTVPVAGYALFISIYAVAGGTGLFVVTAAWAGSYLISALLSASVVRHLVQSDSQPSTLAPDASGRSMRKFGLRGLLGWVSPTETFRIDQLAVGLVLSAHSLGLYTTALAFTNLPRFFAQGVGLIAYPSVAGERDPSGLRRQVVRFVALGGGSATITCATLAVIAHPLVQFTFGDDYISAVPALRVLLLATVLLCVRRVLTECLRGLGQAGIGSRAEMLSWIVLVPGVLVGGQALGLIGVAWALVLTYAASLVYITLFALAHLRDPQVPAQSAALRA